MRTMVLILAYNRRLLTISSVASFQQQVREALLKSDRPAVEIARAVGVHQVNLSQFKAGARDLPTKNLEAIAAELGFEIVLKPKRSK